MANSDEIEDILNEIKQKKSHIPPEDNKPDENDSENLSSKTVGKITSDDEQDDDNTQTSTDSVDFVSKASEEKSVDDDNNDDETQPENFNFISQNIDESNEEIDEMSNDNKSSKKADKKKLAIIIGAVVAVIIIVAVVVCVALNKDEEPQTTTQSTTQETVQAVEEETVIINPLTGSTDYNADAVGKRCIAVVVENTQAARPQWGIDDDTNPPDIILEGEVEGGATRMLWFYADYTSVPDQIGPIRSARPPYIKFSELFDAIFIHWGQSLTKIGTDYIGANTVFRVDEVDHINQMDYSGSVKLFGRDSSRNVSSEHTGVLYGAQIEAAIEEQGFRTQADEDSYTSFSFNEESVAVSDTQCNSLTVAYSSRTNSSTWTYSSDDEMYHSTEYSTDVARKNVLILFDETEYVTKENYKNSGSSEVYCNYLLSGGEGKLASNGTVIDILWSVEDGKIKLTDANGEEVSLNVGTTWIGYASSNNGGSVTVE